MSDGAHRDRRAHGEIAFRNVPGAGSLIIEAGSFVTALGANDSDVERLLGLVAGVIQPDEGGITIDGRDVTLLPLQRRGVALAPVSTPDDLHVSVWQFVERGLTTANITAPERAHALDVGVELLDLGSVADYKLRQVSRVQRHRAEIAQGIVWGPQVLVLADPFGDLDVMVQRALGLELRTLGERTGITIVHSSRDIEGALAAPGLVLVVEGGKVAQFGAPQDVYERPASLAVAQLLGPVNCLTGVTGAPGLVVLDGDQVLHVRRHAGWNEGERTVVVVRPEALRLHRVDALDSERNRFPGNVESSVNDGRLVRYEVRLETGEVLMVSRSRSNRPGGVAPDGTAVVVEFPAERMLLLPG